MDRKVLIFGDSYADPKGTPSYVWHKRLGDVKNLAESGTGPQQAFRKFYKETIIDFDCIIFILADPFRIDFNGGGHFDLSYIAWNGQESYCTFGEPETSKQFLIAAYHRKYKQQIDFYYATQFLELLHFNKKNASFLKTVAHTYGLDVIVFEVVPPLANISNDNNFHLSKYSLKEVSQSEVNGEVSDYVGDRRYNHLSEINHDIMYKYIQSVLHSEPLPQFEQNFLTMQQAYNTNKFIYDE